MSAPISNPPPKSNDPQSVPAWITSGILGIVLGGGATFLSMHFFLYPPTQTLVLTGPPPGVGGPMGAPSSGGGGMMGGAGGGGARAKRDLTSLVGKLDLLSQGVRVEVTPEQASELSEKLATLETAEKMTSDEAQANLESLEASLTDEQKAALASIELPRPARSAGGGGGGPMGMGGPPPGDGGPMGGGGPPRGMGGAPGAGEPDDENPFRQEVNQHRLTELLTRLKSSSPETAPASEQ